MPSVPRRWQPPTARAAAVVAPAARRATSCARGYDARWRKARESFLADHPLCEPCEAAGLTVEATVVDHRIPHRGDPVLFWTRSNWAPMCGPCHGRKSAGEAGVSWAPRKFGDVPPLPGGDEPF
jgi:5-methylcytosine-specific restriction protein A